MSKFMRSHPYAVLLILSLVLYLAGNNLLSVTDTAEANYAETAREMVLSGDWISPQIYGHFWYDKPIFYYWELAASFAVFGFNEAAARLPAAIMGTASLLFTYWFSRKVYGEKIGWLSALIFGVSVETWILSKSVITDTTLYLFMSAAVAFFYLGYAENRKYYYLCYVAAAFATLTKGPIGILLPGLGCVLFLLYKKDIREMLHVHLISGLILFALIGAPWYGIMWHIHGNDFILNFLGVHNFLRATVSEHPSHNTWYFYIIVYLVGFLPWSIFIPYSLYKRWKERKLDFRSAKDATQLLAFYALGVFVFFELIATKYTTYTFPALFSMAILTAILYQNISLRIEKAALGTFVVLIALTFLAAPSIMLKHSGKEVGLALKHMNTGEAPIAFVGDYRTSSVFYSGKDIYRAVPRDELAALEPGGLSWHAKNVMPFMSYETLLVSPDSVMIVQKKEDDPFVKEYTDRENAYSIQVPGAYTIWVSDEHKTIQPVNYK